MWDKWGNKIHSFTVKCKDSGLALPSALVGPKKKNNQKNPTLNSDYFSLAFAITGIFLQGPIKKNISFLQDKFIKKIISTL